MISVRIDLGSAQSAARSRRLATVLIVNDGTGERGAGNYLVSATRDGRRIYKADVKNFPRRSRSALELLRRALNAIHENGGLP